MSWPRLQMFVIDILDEFGLSNPSEKMWTHLVAILEVARSRDDRLAVDPRDFFRKKKSQSYRWEHFQSEAITPWGGHSACLQQTHLPFGWPVVVSGVELSCIPMGGLPPQAFASNSNSVFVIIGACPWESLVMQILHSVALVLTFND